jgi:hypothetical protein
VVAAEFSRLYRGRFAVSVRPPIPVKPAKDPVDPAKEPAKEPLTTAGWWLSSVIAPCLVKYTCITEHSCGGRVRYLGE